MVLWDEVFEAVKKDYPDVETGKLLVDAAAMDFVRRPEAFDVVVASNLFGDILTDLAAIITGSLGLAASANINPERAYPSMFEPVHGSAPDIAGKGVANPLAAILSSGMLLDHLGFQKSANAVRDAVGAVLKAGRPRTPDLGGKDGTKDVADAVLAALCELRRCSSVEQTPAPRRDGTAQLLCRLDPFADHHFRIRQRLLVRRTVGRAPRQFRDLGEERLVFLAPVQDDFVLDVICHFIPPSNSDRLLVGRGAFRRFASQPVRGEDVADLLDLIGLRLTPTRLEVEDFRHPIAGENMMVPTDALGEAHMR